MSTSLVSKTLGTFAALSLLITVVVMAQDKTRAQEKPRQRKNPALAAIQPDPKLPNVLLIGDSISIGYTTATRKLLAGKANLHRIPANGGPTIRGLQSIDHWLGDTKWDVIHFNWGLHDIRRDSGKHQVPIDDYQKNLNTLVERLKKTGAKLIWCSTTPVPEGAGRRTPGDEVKFNQVAAKIMTKNKIPTNDLHAFALKQLDQIQQPKNVHFSGKGSAVLAQEVARHIDAALDAKRRTKN